LKIPVSAVQFRPCPPFLSLITSGNPNVPDSPTASNDPLHMNEKLGHVRIEHAREGKVDVFQVDSPDVYPNQSDEIHAIIEGSIGRDAPPLVLLDLSAVKFVCSAFIGKLVDLRNQIDHLSGTIKILVTHERVAYTMKLVGLQELLEIGADRRALLNSLEAHGE
jgi:anti-anti-sigma factor